MPRYFLGVDVGGTKIEGILLDSNGEELERLRIETPRHDYVETVKAVCQLVHKIERKFEISANVGVGIPGAVSPAMVMSPCSMVTSPSMTPLTSKTTIRGPEVEQAAWRLPGPEASRFVTWMT